MADSDTTARTHAAGRAATASARQERFRPDIQALRAIAVMAVVFYHLWPANVRGGYVGVDIFFVISGFLITRHLSDEVERSGHIRLTQFWARRIRRLLPAAFLVLAVSLVLLLVLMPQVTWQRNLEEIGASATYVENWLLGHNAVDYLASEDSASLVQHYWSLSVEEQFYVAWPLLLLGAIAVGRLFHRTGSRSSVRWALGTLGLVSLAFSVWYTHHSPAMAFFATPTRAWEFAAGGLLALAPGIELGRRDAALRAVASWVGVALVVYSIFFITGNAQFPGWIATIPVMGAVLMLFGGTSSARWSPRPVQSLQPVQWLGDYSYSIYLWHWPLIIVAPWVLARSTNWIDKLVILALSLLLAYLTKRFVEDPVRLGRWWRVRRWPAYGFTAACMAVFLAITVTGYRHVDADNARVARQFAADLADGAACFGAEAIVQPGCSKPFARPSEQAVTFAADDWDLKGALCQQNPASTAAVLCAFGDTRDPIRTIAVVGNSHAVRLIPALDLYGREHRWKILLAARTDCLGATTVGTSALRANAPCLTWSRDAQRQLLATPHLDAVIFVSHASAAQYLAGATATPADLQIASDGVLSTWQKFRAKGIAVMVTEDVPGTRPQPAPECVAQSRASYDPCPKPRSEVVVPNLLSSLALQHPDLVSYVRMSRYFCDANTCHAVIGGVVVYSDAHHLTTTFSRSLAQYVGPEVQALLPRE